MTAKKETSPGVQKTESSKGPGKIDHLGDAITRAEQEILNISAQLIDADKKVADLKDARVAKLETYMALKKLQEEMQKG